MGPAFSEARDAGFPFPSASAFSSGWCLHAGVEVCSGLRLLSETLLEAFPSSGALPRDTRVTVRVVALSEAGGSLIPLSKSFLVEENFCARATLSISTSSPLGGLSKLCDGSGLVALLKLVFCVPTGNCTLVGAMGGSGISVFNDVLATS